MVTPSNKPFKIIKIIMAEKVKNVTTENDDLGGIRKSNILGDKAMAAAMEEIQKEKDDDQKREAKIAYCAITYYNAKEHLMQNKRRREDHIQSEKLDASKKLFERLIGFECEIKDGKLEPTKKKIADDQRLTPAEIQREKDKLNDETRKKIAESDKKYSEGLQELRNSYEGKYRWYDTWD